MGSFEVIEKYRMNELSAPSGILLSGNAESACNRSVNPFSIALQLFDLLMGSSELPIYCRFFVSELRIYRK